MPKRRTKAHTSAAAAVLSSTVRRRGHDESDDHQHDATRIRSSSGLPSPLSFFSSAKPAKVSKLKTASTHKLGSKTVVPPLFSNAASHHDSRQSGDATIATTAAPRESEDEQDERVIQVAIRCRPRKKQRRHQQLSRRRSSVTRSDSLDADSSCSSDSSELDDSDNDASSRHQSVIEYDCSTNGRGRNDAAAFLPAQRKPSLSIQAHTQAAASGAKRRFEFDFVFPPWIKQQEVYETSVQTQVAHVLRAHAQRRAPTHATVVAYGQTGTGKTYTMGMLTSVHDEVERGVIPRAISQIMDYARSYNSQQPQQHLSKSDGLAVSMSYLQIYLETIQDLLVFPVDSHAHQSPAAMPKAKSGRPAGGDLQVRQRQSDQAFYVEGLSEYDVASLDDVHVLLETAARNRILAATARNKTSSRSHTLLTISLKRSARRRQASSYSDGSDSSSEEDEQEDDDEHAYTLSFVDLAGSERVDGTLHFLSTTRKRQELRIREAKFINRSLSALGSVIAALAQPKQRGRAASSLLQSSATTRRSTQAAQLQPAAASAQQRHIRFRDSQLTKLLQSRLMAGRGRLLLIATVDDEVANLTETLSTLKFASQCRRVELRGSPRSRADRKRKDSLLEQVFREMKASYEEREAALHREYQERLEALEEKLQLAKSDASSKRRGGSESALQFASYAALCALVDQALAASGGGNAQKKLRHPAISAFVSEQEMVSYIKELYEKLQTAIKSSASAALQPESASGIQQMPPATVAKRSLQRSASFATPNMQAADRHEPLSRRASSPSRPTTTVGMKQTPAAEAVKTPTAQRLRPDQEDEFRAVARLLLASPEQLQAYRVYTDEDIDSSFSQLDCNAATRE